MAQAGGGGGGGSSDWNLGTAASDGFDDGNVRPWPPLPQGLG